ncbi:patatin-like phospholipase family protein [Micromonospora chersina]|uniref:patatin-like phospholipase family protein n=1 Tax=Micromonospora chersina TaxID=47854 RepID=UPI0034046732
MRIAVALGAGGARGYAHIGAIQALEERGFDIVGVAGSSIGALVGALYASGKLQAYAEWVCTIGQREVLRLLDPALGAPGAIRGEKVMAEVRELLDGVRIEELSIPFAAVATDLRAGRAVWFQRGPAEVAVRASIAVPLAITPIMVDGRLLADGGLMEPLPVAPTTFMPADAVVAVSLPVKAGRTGSGEGAAAWASAGAGPAAQIVTGLVNDDGPLGELPADLRALDVISLSIEAVRDQLIRYRLAGHPPDLLIQIPTSGVRMYDFHRATEMIEVGRRATLDALASNPFA